MARTARKKDPAAVYHVMSRSISEFQLFPEDSDKDYFLDLLQKLAEGYHIKIYSFCIMDTHYHLLIDACGYDISKLMKSLNQRYVKYVNRKYKRRGHLLNERFTSKIIDNFEYLISASSYIHNNPKDLEKYTGREYEYRYSSMGIYLGIHKDRRNLVDTSFILKSINENDRSRAVQAYREIVAEQCQTGLNTKQAKYIAEFQKEQYEYQSHRETIVRDKDPEEVIKTVAGKLGIEDTSEIMHRWKRRAMEFRRVVAYALNVFCGMGMKEISRRMYNISSSCCARLCNEGFEIMKKNSEIKNLLLGLCS
jgi:putative transposase